MYLSLPLICFHISIDDLSHDVVGDWSAVTVERSLSVYQPGYHPQKPRLSIYFRIIFGTVDTLALHALDHGPPFASSE